MSANTFGKKLLTCFIAGLLLAANFLLVGRDGRPRWIGPEIVFIFAGISLLAGLVFPIFWHIRQNKNWALQLFPFLCSLISGLIAFNLSSFGWKKIFHLQFQVPLHIVDEPVGHLSGEWLTWFYFGYAPAFAYLVGGIQILGSLLLLFRKTRLLGVMIILPVILNIMFINIFYQLNPGALLQSVVLVIGVIFLLILDYKRLVETFFHTKESLSETCHLGIGTKNLLRFVVVAAAFGFVVNVKNMADENPLLDGRYNVESLKINDAIVDPDFGKAVITKVYFDLGHTLIIKYRNPDRQLIAPYEFDAQKNVLKAMFKEPDRSFTLVATVSRRDKNGLVLSGKLGGDGIKMMLVKAE